MTRPIRGRPGYPSDCVRLRGPGRDGRRLKGEKKPRPWVI